MLSRVGGETVGRGHTDGQIRISPMAGPGYSEQQLLRRERGGAGGSIEGLNIDLSEWIRSCRLPERSEPP